MRILLLFSLLAFTTTSQAQTKVFEGSVLDATSNTAVAGATITVLPLNQSKATDGSGNFSFVLAVNKKYSFRVSAIGYQTKLVNEIDWNENSTSAFVITLSKAAKTEEAVIITSSAKKESINALLSFQKNTNSIAQVISAEAIKRSPDKNTGEVLKRVPGTSVQEGKYLVVRGLADRYNQAMLNGILLSSTEPDRKTFSFDIIPSSMIDNIIINKAFVPECPGEWAGGLVQVNTKDVPTKNFFDVQIGTGFNTQTIGKEFYSYPGSKTDFLGFDNGLRSLPNEVPTKAAFAALTNEEKTGYAKYFTNSWATEKNGAVMPNQSLLFNGGFNFKTKSNSKLAALFSVNYNQSYKRTRFQNQINLFENNTASLNFDYDNTKYSKDILAGALANITWQKGNKHKISFKNILNVNTTNYSTLRTGKDYESNSVIGDNIKATELAFKANTFFNTQLSGSHKINNFFDRFNWFGSFNILDQYIPDQRRIQYNQDDPSNPNSPYSLLVGASKNSQKSGSRYFGTLNDYVYTAGADLDKKFTMGTQQQTVKGGYFFQVKDRLFNSRPFAIYLPSNNSSLRSLPANEIFAAENFGNGYDNKFAFNELSGISYRYIANSILNAGFLQIDNRFTEKLRMVWGLRVENFDQVVGSMRKSDPRFVHSEVTDFLPAINLTYKLNNQTNIRLTGSQTVIRPEFRELSTFQFYDFDLGATVAGNTALKRTQVANFDLRYELYPEAGSLFTLGMFYKYFKNPIEAYFNVGAGGSSTYNFINADEANSFGAEVEFRKKLDFVDALKNFTLQTNASYIFNRVTSEQTDLNRPMQGQSPYLLNAVLQYDVVKSGLSATVLFNQIGRRIVFVGGSDQPPIWENPRALLDLQFAKKLMQDRGEIKLNISDVLNNTAIFYTDLNNNKKYDKNLDAFAIRRNYGSNVSLSFSYKFIK